MTLRDAESPLNIITYMINSDEQNFTTIFEKLCMRRIILFIGDIDNNIA